MGSSLLYFDELNSTNKYAKEMVSGQSLHGTLILADWQKQGRGQYDRSWIASADQNLTFSIILEPNHSVALTTLTLACALAVADVCSYLTRKECKLKWPNDVFCEGKKIAGLLTESVFLGSQISRLVIGIGLNVNETAFGSGLKHATSLAKLTGSEFERERVLSQILTKIEYYYRLWETKDIALIKMINKHLIGYGKWVHLTVDDKPREGLFKFLGINETGSMMVLNKELEVDTFAHEQIRIHLD